MVEAAAVVVAAAAVALEWGRCDVLKAQINLLGWRLNQRESV